MITGSLVALVTPFNVNSHEIDWGSLKSLIDWHVDQGTDGIVTVGTTGESATLNVDEHSRVIDFVVQCVDGRLPVIAGTGANCTREAVALTRTAKEVGADACLLVTPYYNKPTQYGLYLHFKTIAEEVDIPQILYNVPGRTACDMSTDTVLELAKLANICGLKDATGDLERGAALISQTPSKFSVYSGDDMSARQLMTAGAHGNISVTANIVPKLMAEMCRAALSGADAEAENIDQKLRALHLALFLESNPIPVKWALSRMGYIENVLRLPLTSMSESNGSAIETAMRDAMITFD